MPEQHNHIDSLIKDKLDGSIMEPSGDLWQKIESNLDGRGLESSAERSYPKPKKGLSLKLSTLIAVLATAGGLLTYVLFQQPEPLSETNSAESALALKTKLFKPKSNRSFAKTSNSIAPPSNEETEPIKEYIPSSGPQTAIAAAEEPLENAETVQSTESFNTNPVLIPAPQTVLAEVETPTETAVESTGTASPIDEPKREEVLKVGQWVTFTVEYENINGEQDWLYITDYPSEYIDINTIEVIGDESTHFKHLDKRLTEKSDGKIKWYIEYFFRPKEQVIKGREEQYKGTWTYRARIIKPGTESEIRMAKKAPVAEFHK